MNNNGHNSEGRDTSVTIINGLKHFFHFFYFFNFFYNFFLINVVWTLQRWSVLT